MTTIVTAGPGQSQETRTPPRSAILVAGIQVVWISSADLTGVLAGSWIAKRADGTQTDTLILEADVTSGTVTHCTITCLKYRVIFKYISKLKMCQGCISHVWPMEKHYVAAQCPTADQLLVSWQHRWWRTTSDRRFAALQTLKSKLNIQNEVFTECASLLYLHKVKK